MKEDYYEILGVAKNAPLEEIKVAYRALVKKYHPDLFPEVNQAQRGILGIKIACLNEAYEILSDPEKRKAYDDGLEECDIEGEERTLADQDEVLLYSILEYLKRKVLLGLQEYNWTEISHKDSFDAILVGKKGLRKWCVCIKTSSVLDRDVLDLILKDATEFVFFPGTAWISTFEYVFIVAAARFQDLKDLEKRINRFNSMRWHNKKVFMGKEKRLIVLFDATTKEISCSHIDDLWMILLSP